MKENFLSIKDLKDKEASGEEISPQQHLAIKNFERYRERMLNENNSKKAFEMTFQKLQAQAKLTDYTEFLKDDYLQ